jgi:hypothetical protein
MGGFHLARTAILARVARLRKSVVPLWWLWTGRDFLAVHYPLVVGIFWAVRFAHGRFVLGSIVKAVDPGAVTFLDQAGFGIQPMLHGAPFRSAFVHIGEICRSRHFLRTGHETDSGLVGAAVRCCLCISRFSIGKEFFVFHICNLFPCGIPLGFKARDGLRVSRKKCGGYGVLPYPMLMKPVPVSQPG